MVMFVEWEQQHKDNKIISIPLKSIDINQCSKKINRTSSDQTRKWMKITLSSNNKYHLFWHGKNILFNYTSNLKKDNLT